MEKQAKANVVVAEQAAAEEAARPPPLKQSRRVTERQEARERHEAEDAVSCHRFSAVRIAQASRREDICFRCRLLSCL